MKVLISYWCDLLDEDISESLDATYGALQELKSDLIMDPSPCGYGTNLLFKFGKDAENALSLLQS